jgi:hypothetical protein
VDNTGCGKLTSFLYGYIHIKKEVSLPHSVLGRILDRRDGVMWIGLVWLRMGTGGELL